MQYILLKLKCLQKRINFTIYPYCFIFLIFVFQGLIRRGYGVYAEKAGDNKMGFAAFKGDECCCHQAALKIRDYYTGTLEFTGYAESCQNLIKVSSLIKGIKYALNKLSFFVFNLKNIFKFSSCYNHNISIWIKNKKIIVSCNQIFTIR